MMELDLRCECPVTGHPNYQIFSAIELRLSWTIPPRFSGFSHFNCLWNPYFLASSVTHSKILAVDCLDQLGTDWRSTHSLGEGWSLRVPLLLKHTTQAKIMGGLCWDGGFPESSAGKESTCNAGDPGSIPGSGNGIGYPLQSSWASLVAQLAKNPPAVWETWVQSLGWEDPLEKWKATHSSILAWRMPWTV